MRNKDQQINYVLPTVITNPIVRINLQKKKNVKKSESHKVADIDATSSTNASMVDTAHKTVVVTRLSEDNDTISDDILTTEDIDVIESSGNNESLSAGSFVDIVSGK